MLPIIHPGTLETLLKKKNKTNVAPNIAWAGFLDDDHSSCVLAVIGRRDLEHGLRFCKWRLTVEEKFWRAVRSTVRIDQVCFVLTIMHLITQNDIRVNDWLNGGAMASCIVPI